MKNLIMKDIRLIGIKNLFVLGIGIICGYIGISFRQVLASNFVYGLGIVFAIFFVDMCLSSSEIKTKSHALIISMPVKRFQIVLARYISLLIYIYTSLGIMFIISNIGKILFDNVPGRPLDLMGIIIISSLIIIFISFYNPFQYYSVRNAQIFSAILYMIVINIPNILDRFNIGLENFDFILGFFTKNTSILGLVLFSISLILYMVSSLVSRKIYELKEF